MSQPETIWIRPEDCGKVLPWMGEQVMVWILSPSLPVEIKLKFVESTIEKRKSIQKYGSNQQIQQISGTETTAGYSYEFRTVFTDFICPLAKSLQ